MSFESLDTSEKALDERWFSRMAELQPESFELLFGDGDYRTEQREKFLTNEIDNPTLDYPALLEYDFATHESALLDLKEDILEQEPNEVVRKIYRAKVNEAIATVRMLQAAAVNNDRVFARYASFIYGVPSQEDAAYVTQYVHNRAGKAVAGKTPAKQEAGAVVQSMLSPALEALPQPDMSFVPQIEGESIEGNIESFEEITEAFREALDAVGADHWEVAVDTERGITGYSVSQKEQQVNVPSEEVMMSRSRSRKYLQTYIEHEVNTHVQRRINGERSQLKLLGIGLDRYEKGEEGVATYNEQQISGAKEFSHPERYFAIALAKGAVDGVPRDFRGTFDVLKQYYTVVLKNGDDLETRAERKAWDLCVRVFRGTTCSTPGAVYTKDLAYFQGNKETWWLVNQDSDVTESFTKGKFDMYNKQHVYLLSQLGILDEDLNELLAETT